MSNGKQFHFNDSYRTSCVQMDPIHDNVIDDTKYLILDLIHTSILDTPVEFKHSALPIRLINTDSM